MQQLYLGLWEISIFAALGRREQKEVQNKQLSFRDIGSVPQVKFTLIRNHLEAVQQIESSAGIASWQVAYHKGTSQLPNIAWLV